MSEWLDDLLVWCYAVGGLWLVRALRSLAYRRVPLAIDAVGWRVAALVGAALLALGLFAAGGWLVYVGLDYAVNKAQEARLFGPVIAAGGAFVWLVAWFAVRIVRRIWVDSGAPA